MLREIVHFAVFGMALTVLVGWSFALWAESPVMHAAGLEGPQWPSPPRAGWPGEPRVAMEGRTTGYRLCAAQTLRRIEDEDEVRGFRFGIEYRLEAHEAGWPARAFRWERWVELDDHGARGLMPLPVALRDLGRTRQRGLPYGMRAGAVALNVLVFGAAGWLVFGLPRSALRARRAWQGRCLKCGYPRGDGGVCTECGAHASSGAVRP